MAPRTGPQGVTNEDVARRAGVTYVYAPATNQPTTIDPAMLNAYLIGGQAPGYGMKYGGFPTATYGEAAITGQAYGIADLARQAAEQAQFEREQIGLDYETDARRALAAKYRYQPSQALESYVPPFEGATEAQKVMRQSALQSAIAEESQKRMSEMYNTDTPAYRAAQQKIASLPSVQLSEALGVFTPSQLAQQIAVSRYGYDPMLAAGLFGEGVNTAYANQQEVARQAQLQAMGYNIGLSNDEILASQLSPEEFEQYQMAKARQALETATTDTTAQDEQIASQYGIAPSNNTERQIMGDPAFLDLFRKGIAEMQKLTVASPAQAASAVARQYLTENPTQTVRAILLEDLLSQYAFVAQPLVPVDLPGT